MAIGATVSTTTYNDFIARFPEFVPQGETIIKGSIEEAAKLIDEATVSSTIYPTALAWLAAHLLALRLREVGMQIGAVNASIFGALMSKEWLSSTEYGQTYEGLIQSTVADRIGFVV